MTNLSQSVPKDGRFSTEIEVDEGYSANGLNPSRRTAGSAPAPQCAGGRDLP